NENSANVIDEPAVEQIFGSWNELDRFISFYTKSQNFVSVIRGSEYSDGICRSRRYACEHQGHSGTNKTGIAENQRQTRNDMLKDIKFWTEIGNINMKTQYQMLVKQYPDVFFLPQDLSNAIQNFKRQNHVECEAATLLNNLLEHKSKDNRWIINWKIDPANNSLTSLFWMSPDQYDLYIRYRDVVQHDNTYSTNRFKMAL
ncbi:38113_t:CDS:2, partial [Gigaspora margarita]